jgi:hypothetical protein
MKFTQALFTSIAFLSVASTSSAVIYSAAFDTPTYNNGNTQNVAGQDGWSINDAASQLSFFGNNGSNYYGALGGYFSTPGIKNIELSHTANTPLVGASFYVTTGVRNSTASFPNRDAFGWSLKDSGNNILLRVAFEPVAGQPGRLEVIWYDGAGSPTSTGVDIYNNDFNTLDNPDVDGIYELSISFTGSGANAAFNAAISGQNSFTFNGTLAGLANATLDKVVADFDILGATAADAGDNFMFFDNVQVIPEPTTTLFGLASLAGLALRRRRK